MHPLERAWAFDRELQERSAERVVRFDRGAALYTDELPNVYDANFIRLDRGFEAMGAGELADLADTLQRHLDHRKVVLPDERAGARLAGELRRLGWRGASTVVMRYAGPGLRDPAATASAEMIDPRALRGAREAVLADRAPDIRRQIADYPERLALANDARTFAGRFEGEIGAFCTLFTGDGIGEVDEVTTLARFRRRGLGRAVVEAALQTSLALGNDLTFLLAADNDWPKQWYGRLGFEVIGRRYDLWLAKN